MGSDASRMSPTEIASQIKGWGAAYHQFEGNIANSGLSGSVLAKMHEDEVDDFCDLIGVTNKVHRMKFRLQFKEIKSKMMPHGDDFENGDRMVTSSLTQHVPLTLTLSQNMSRVVDYSSIARDGARAVGGGQMGYQMGGYDRLTGMPK